MGTVKNILIVDDSAMQLSMLESTLNQCGCGVICKAMDGKEALSIAHHQAFDLVITDISMPQMNGFALIERLRQLDSHKHTPIMIVTTSNNDAAKKRAQEVGANAFVIKPFSPESITSVAKTLLKII